MLTAVQQQICFLIVFLVMFLHSAITPCRENGIWDSMCGGPFDI